MLLFGKHLWSKV